MDKRILYNTLDGALAVGEHARKSVLTMEQFIAKIVPEGTSYVIVDTTALPTDRIFRRAWKLNGQKLEVDLPEAKLIAHEARRVKRSEEYKDVDGDVVDVAVTPAGQAKRDNIQVKYDRIQVDMDAAATVAQLKGVMQAEGWV